MGSESAYQSECPNEHSCQMWDRFEDKYGDAHIRVKWSRSSGYIKEIYGWYEVSKSEISRQEAVDLSRSFLSENVGLFGVDVKQLKFHEIKSGAVVYRQYYHDIPVYGGNVIVAMDKRDGKTYVSAIDNNFYRGINVSTEPELTREQVVDIITGAVGINLSAEATTQRVEKMSLHVVSGYDGQNISYHLVWMAPMHNLYFVDSTTGDVVYAEVAPGTKCPLGYNCVLIVGESNLQKYWKILVIAILFLALPLVLRKRGEKK